MLIVYAMYAHNFCHTVGFFVACIDYFYEKRGFIAQLLFIILQVSFFDCVSDSMRCVSGENERLRRSASSYSRQENYLFVHLLRVFKRRSNIV